MSLIVRARKAFEAIRPRMLPKLIIVGAQKAGTTTVFDLLARHPKVLPPVRKELHFFDREEVYRKGIGHYRSYFPAAPLRARGFVTLEASPRYLYFSKTCAPRIARHLPRAHCLILLRAPVKRAYSAWNMCRTVVKRPGSLGVPDHRSFAQAIEDELAGRTESEQHMYLARSSYADQVQDYLQHIRPGQVIVRSFLELLENPDNLVNDICKVMGIPPLEAMHERSTMRSNARTYTEPLDPGLERELYAYFKPKMEQLRTVLGRDIKIVEHPTFA